MTGAISADRAIHLGYSDKELERRSELIGKLDSCILPWAMWESEHTGYGLAFRKLARYPRLLPLFFSCDHGVMLSAKCWENEMGSPYPMFFTCLSRKREVLRDRYGKRAYHIFHPWVHYRRTYFPTLPDERRGTLVFFPHSNGTSSPVIDVDRYIDDLKSLPSECQPVVICLSFHDVHGGLHRKLRKYGIPLVTVGHGNSQRFIDRFYSLLYHFRYASSPNIGSHTFYIMESGVPFFLHGEYPRIAIKNSTHTEDGIYGEEIRGGNVEESQRVDRFIKLMYHRTERVTPEQQEIIAHYLGLNSTLSRGESARLIWRELLSIRNWATYLRSVLERIRQRVAARG